MSFRSSRPRNNGEPILPLINVVFLLLVFFMLTGRLAGTDPVVVEPPRSASEAMPGARALVIVLGSDGQLAFNGQIMDRRDLAAAVTQRVAGERQPAVWLKADGAADSVQVIAVMAVLRDAGVRHLKLLTVPGRGTGQG